MENKKILIISTEKWGDNFVCKHHYAKYLSENNQVYFLGPAQGSHKSPLKKQSIQAIKISDNLTVIEYKNLIPKLNSAPKVVQERLYKKMAKNIQSHSCESFDLVWSFDPYRFFNQGVWVSDKRLYHSADIHYNAKYENEIAKSSDIIISISKYLDEKLPEGSTSHPLGHATDIHSDDKYDSSFPGNNKIKAAMVGNFSNYLDYNLIGEIAETSPEVDFIFVGPKAESNLGSADPIVVSQIEELEKTKNIFFIGEVRYSRLNDLLSKVDINLTLYKQELRVVNAHKILSYLLSGNVTICSYIQDYDGADENLISIVDNNEDLPNRIKEIASNLEYWNSENLMSIRKNYAIDRSYPNKIKEISQLIYK